MKLNNRTQNSIVNIICSLYALLFTYAATSKLLDFNTFRIQLGQSPLLSAFTDWISIIIPVTEIIIAMMLLLPRLRFTGLFAAYSLMAMFTAYIYIILNYSSFIPCSCGGILQKMTWNQHLIFNIGFIFLAVIAVLLMPMKSISNQRKRV
ncbi:putative membrane protein YphA (DoxX/SURF4 family) [Flavobacterium sp. CG_9.10]|uniref:MauE/DoxX family redox-associated membrane protein n=1 Tax=Flavobacterium sp. CG_9.10 TaxID=2787729 RepID=UPI0018CB7DBF|nr:MauE/DoxX family redox-associated membrane protein [Flavobacterium sp. CG_9.10]MBG6109822.1 putative membrane protein YphA (DoxX/SURF4 family) [Flavobacterium sp. CG_9.10]